MAARIADADVSSMFDFGNCVHFGKLVGIAKAEQLPFLEAVTRCGVEGVELNATVAAKHAAQMKNHGEGGALTADHIAAIHMYTQACDFYRSLNACLRDRNRDCIKPFLPYLRLLLEGLRRLPAKSRIVYCGVKLDLSAKFREGDEPVWWSVTSTLTTMGELQSKDFCGLDDEPRTIFAIRAAHARDIAAFSAISSEEEYILLPGAQLKVISLLALGGGRNLVEMHEVDEPMSLAEFEDAE